MTRDELVDIALETFFCSLEDYSWPHAVDDPMHRLRHQVSSAINVVLEEAADAVSDVGDCAEVGAYLRAIRALKGESK